MEIKEILGIILVSGFVIIMTLNLLKSKNSFFNVIEIFKKHFSLFKYCKRYYILFYGLPLLFAIGLSLLWEADTTLYNDISVIIGIILSMLFAILSILTNYDFDAVEDEGQRDRAKTTLAETVNAIVFSSLLCIFILIYSLVIIVCFKVDLSFINMDFTNIKIMFSTLLYYTFTVILLTLLLIVKHMSKIIEFKNIVGKNN